MHKKRIAITLILSLASEILNKIAPIIVLYLGKRRLGVEGLGFALLGIAYIELFSPLITYGYSHLASVALAKDSQNPELSSSWFSRILFLRIMHAGLMFLIFSLGVIFIPAFYPYLFFIPAAFFCFLFNALDSVWIFWARQMMARISYFVIIARVISLGLIFGLVSSPTSAFLFATLVLLANNGIGLFSFVKALPQIGLKRIEREGLLATFKLAHPFAVVYFLMILMERIDVLIVSHFFDYAAVGVYGGLQRIANSLYQIVNVIALTFFSEMISISDRNVLSRHLNWGLWAIVVCVSPMILGIYFTAPEVLELIYGQDFVAHADLLLLSVVASSLSVLVSVFSLQVLMVLERLREIMLALALGAAANLLFADLLAQTTLPELYSVALATIIAKALAVALLAFFGRDLFLEVSFRKLAFALLPALFMAGVLHWGAFSGLIAKLAVGIASYSIMFGLMNLNFIKNVLRHKRIAS